MINIEFKFVDAPRLIRNEFILSVDYTHGDGDGDTTEEHTYSDSAEDQLQLKQDILGLITLLKTNSEFEDFASELTPIFEAQGIEDAYDQAEEWVDKFHEHDITCEDRGAGISDYRLTFYDDSGDRFNVELYLNGRKVE